MFDYWQANREPYVPKDAEMTSDRWNDAVNNHSLDVASVAFLINKDVAAVFMAPIRACVVPVHRLPVKGAQEGGCRRAGQPVRVGRRAGGDVSTRWASLPGWPLQVVLVAVGLAIGAVLAPIAGRPVTEFWRLSVPAMIIMVVVSVAGG